MYSTDGIVVFDGVSFKKEDCVRVAHTDSVYIFALRQQAEIVYKKPEFPEKLQELQGIAQEVSDAIEMANAKSAKKGH